MAMIAPGEKRGRISIREMIISLGSRGPQPGFQMGSRAAGTTLKESLQVA
jgi:hypothetical protein